MSQTAELRIAQGIVCGHWALAFPFDWARQIVESFELSAIPKSPAWLLGSANIDSNIVPVVDLALYFGSLATRAFAAPQRRLLLGGPVGGELALVFTGLPQQIKYLPAPLTYSAALPLQLRSVCTSVAQGADGREFLEINTRLLSTVLAEELSLL